MDYLLATLLYIFIIYVFVRIFKMLRRKFNAKAKTSKSAPIIIKTTPSASQPDAKTQTQPTTEAVAAADAVHSGTQPQTGDKDSQREPELPKPQLPHAPQKPASPLDDIINSIPVPRKVQDQPAPDHSKQRQTDTDDPFKGLLDQISIPQTPSAKDNGNTAKNNN